VSPEKLTADSCDRRTRLCRINYTKVHWTFWWHSSKISRQNV